MSSNLCRCVLVCVVTTILIFSILLDTAIMSASEYCSRGIAFASTATKQEILNTCYWINNIIRVVKHCPSSRAEETSTQSSSGIRTVNCRPTESNYQLSHLRQCQEPNPSLRGGRRECYH